MSWLDTWTAGIAGAREAVRVARAQRPETDAEREHQREEAALERQERRRAWLLRHPKIDMVVAIIEMAVAITKRIGMFALFGMLALFWSQILFTFMGWEEPWPLSLLPRLVPVVLDVPTTCVWPIECVE